MGLFVGLVVELEESVSYKSNEIYVHSRVYTFFRDLTEVSRK